MRKELLTYKEPKSPVSEIFRTLRTNIQFMNTNRKMKTLLITSTFPEEGKSWVTSNLAVTFAQAGKRVILIDADMRKGRQYKIFDVLPKPGLSNYLSNMDAENMEMDAENVNIANYIQNTDVENLHILVAGNVPPNPSELLVSTRMRALLQELKEMCDLIIIDGTPCDLVTDSIILSRFVDSTIIVTAQKETKKDNLERIVKNIQNVGGRIAGVVVNKVDMSTKKYNQQYYYGSISGNSIKKKSKHSKTTDDMLSNLFKFAQKEEKEDKKQEEEKDIKDEIDDIIDDMEKDEKIKSLMEEFVDIEKKENEDFKENEENNLDNYETPNQEKFEQEQFDQEKFVHEQFETEFKQEDDNSEQEYNTIEQENNDNVKNDEETVNIEPERIETPRVEETQKVNNYNNNQYNSRNKKHRNKHRNRNRNNNFNNSQNNVEEQNNYNKYYDYDKTENNNEEIKETQNSENVVNTNENTSSNKANEIRNLVNSYIESEKKKQERKF